MTDRVGEDFDALIISTTKYGLFVELTDLFVEGLVPIDTLPGDQYLITRTSARSSANAAAMFASATRCACGSIAWTATNASWFLGWPSNTAAEKKKRKSEES